MNIVAASLALHPADEVLLTSHEYGAVRRLWSRVCRNAGARLVIADLPVPLAAADSIVAAVLAKATERTRLIVVSHMTSPTALVFPVQAICDAARKRGIPTCIDGPHAVAMLPLNLKQLGCDFYTASCHKWLCAPFGSGFLYVDRRFHGRMKPAIVSWGGSLSGRPPRWQDEYHWLGTRDPAPLLAIPAAIEFLRGFGLDEFRRQTHELARYARRGLLRLSEFEPLQSDSIDGFGSMVTVPLPTPAGWKPVTHGFADPVQLALREQHNIEVPVLAWDNRRYIRVSCHLYNSASEIDHLCEALRPLL